jgi:hypothetical protein
MSIASRISLGMLLLHQATFFPALESVTVCA